MFIFSKSTKSRENSIYKIKIKLMNWTSEKISQTKKNLKWKEFPQRKKDKNLNKMMMMKKKMKMNKA